MPSTHLRRTSIMFLVSMTLPCALALTLGAKSLRLPVLPVSYVAFPLDVLSIQVPPSVAAQLKALGKDGTPQLVALVYEGALSPESPLLRSRGKAHVPDGTCGVLCEVVGDSFDSSADASANTVMRVVAFSRCRVREIASVSDDSELGIDSLWPLAMSVAEPLLDTSPDSAIARFRVAAEEVRVHQCVCDIESFLATSDAASQGMAAVGDAFETAVIDPVCSFGVSDDSLLAVHRFAPFAEERDAAASDCCGVYKAEDNTQPSSTGVASTFSAADTARLVEQYGEESTQCMLERAFVHASGAAGASLHGDREGKTGGCYGESGESGDLHARVRAFACTRAELYSFAAARTLRTLSAVEAQAMLSHRDTAARLQRVERDLSASRARLAARTALQSAL